MICQSYKKIPQEKDWKIVLQNYVDKQYDIAKNVKKDKMQDRTR